MKSLCLSGLLVLITLTTTSHPAYSAGFSISFEKTPKGSLLIIHCNSETDWEQIFWQLMSLGLAFGGSERTFMIHATTTVSRKQLNAFFETNNLTPPSL